MELSLPSGKTAKIVSYFNRGEINEIKRLSWDGAVAEQMEDGMVRINNIPVNQGALEEDATVLNGMKFYDGKEVNRDVVNNMPIDDFNVVVLELKKVLAGKKKSN